MTHVQDVTYAVDLDRLPEGPGLYVFARRWGKGLEALYVGQSMTVRRRIQAHLTRVQLMRHIKDAASGERVVITGTIVTKPGQQIERSLGVVERALIRHFLLDGHDLVNIQGTHLRQHEITHESRPLRFVPKTMFLERTP